MKKVIEAERPDLKLEVRNIADSVPEGIVHTRIRIFCDKEGIVRFSPKVGESAGKLTVAPHTSAVIVLPCPPVRWAKLA